MNQAIKRQPVVVNPLYTHENELRSSLSGEWLFRLDPNDVGIKEKWFNFPMPKPTIKKDFIEKALEKYEQTKNQSYRSKISANLQKDFVWLPDSVEILPSQNNQYQLCWFYMGEIFYSDFTFASKSDAISAVENLNKLWIWNQDCNQENIKIPEKLFYELRRKGLCKKL